MKTHLKRIFDGLLVIVPMTIFCHLCYQLADYKLSALLVGASLLWLAWAIGLALESLWDKDPTPSQRDFYKNQQAYFQDLNKLQHPEKEKTTPPASQKAEQGVTP